MIRIGRDAGKNFVASETSRPGDACIFIDFPLPRNFVDLGLEQGIARLQGDQGHENLAGVETHARGGVVFQGLKSRRIDVGPIQVHPLQRLHSAGARIGVSAFEGCQQRRHGGRSRHAQEPDRAERGEALIG